MKLSSNDAILKQLAEHGVQHAKLGPEGELLEVTFFAPASSASADAPADNDTARGEPDDVFAQAERALEQVRARRFVDGGEA